MNSEILNKKYIIGDLIIKYYGKEKTYLIIDKKKDFILMRDTDTNIDEWKAMNYIEDCWYLKHFSWKPKYE